MGKIKDQLNQQGFAFSPQEEIERKALTHRKIAELKRQLKLIETRVKLFKPTNIEEHRAAYRKIKEQIREL